MATPTTPMTRMEMSVMYPPLFARYVIVYCVRGMVCYGWRNVAEPMKFLENEYSLLALGLTEDSVN